MFSADCTFKRSGGITCAAPSMAKGKAYWEPGLASHASQAGVLLISVETRFKHVTWLHKLLPQLPKQSKTTGAHVDDPPDELFILTPRL